MTKEPWPTVCSRGQGREYNEQSINYNVLLKLTREYGENVPTLEVLEVEKALLAVAESLFAKLEA